MRAALPFSLVAAVVAAVVIAATTAASTNGAAVTSSTTTQQPPTRQPISAQERDVSTMEILPFKPCLHRNEPPAGSFCAVPSVPNRLCQGDSCRGPQDGTPVCGVVAHSLLSEFEIFDVVFLHDGLCRRDIPAGPLSKEIVDDMLPYDQNLVVLNLNGSDLLAALEHGLDLRHNHGISDAYPATAGVRFRVNMKTPYGHRISRAEILNTSCEWKPVRPRQTYQVLTTESLADGYFDYPFLTRAVSRTNTDIGVSDSIWNHARSTCGLRDPYFRPKMMKRKQQPQGRKPSLSTCSAKHT